MSEWRDNATRGEWGDIMWEFLEADDEENTNAQRELLAMLRKVVPFEDRVNLMERHARHDTLAEAKVRATQKAKEDGLSKADTKNLVRHTMWAAVILEKLSAQFASDIDWVQQVENVAGAILADEGQKATYKDAAVGNEGAAAPEFTRLAHAKRALELADSARLAKRLAQSEAKDAEDADWLIDMINETSEIAYQAGRHLQSAWGKPIEELAVKAANSALGRHKTHVARKNNASEKFAPAMAKMRELILTMSEESATENVARQNLDPKTQKPFRGFSPKNLAKKFREQR